MPSLNKQSANEVAKVRFTTKAFVCESTNCVFLKYVVYSANMVNFYYNSMVRKSYQAQFIEERPLVLTTKDKSGQSLNCFLYHHHQHHLCPSTESLRKSCRRVLAAVFFCYSQSSQCGPLEIQRRLFFAFPLYLK